MTLRGFALLILCACEGGGGTIPDVPDIERPPISYERPNQRAATGTPSPTAPGQREDDDDGEPSPPRAGSTTLDCNGTYSCTEAGGAQPSQIRLERNGDACRFDNFVLEANGQVTSGGNTVGGWVVSNAGLTITASGRVLNCTK